VRKETGTLQYLRYGILRVAGKLRKATITFVNSVCKEQLSPHWTAFHEILYWELPLKSVEKK